MKDFLSKIDCNDFISLDIETTGLDYTKDHIIEVSAHRFINGKISATFSSLINSPINVSQFITDLTGISNKMLINQPEFKDIINDLIEFIGNRHIIGHNVFFDLNFLSNKSNNFKEAIKNNDISDTYTLSKIFCYYCNSFSLVSLCYYFDIDVPKSHRAEEDAKNSGMLFLKLLKIACESRLTSLDKLIISMRNYSMANKTLIQNISQYIIDNDIIDINNEMKNILSSNFEYTSQNKSYKNLSISDVFDTGGILDSKLTQYEFRENQKKLSKDILTSFNDNKNLVAQGGAGIGKTYAYISAGLVSLMNSKKTKLIISTHTHSLQDQIFNKDLPMIVENLDLACKAVIVKGSNNYLCLNRLDELVRKNDITLNEQEVLALQSLIVWSDITITGDVAECNSFRKENSYRIWNLVNYQSESCSFSRCNFDSKCFYTNVRKSILNANIIVVNHSLLINYSNKENFLNDSNSICVIDECHNFHGICKDQLSSKISINKLNVLFDKVNSIYKDKNKFKFKNYKNIIDQIILSKETFSNLMSEIIEDREIYSNAYPGYNNTYNLNSLGNYQVEIDNFLDNFFILSSKIKEYHINYLSEFEVNNFIKSKLESIDNFLIKLRQEIEYVLNFDEDKVIWISFDFINQSIANISLNACPFFLKNQMNKIYEQFSSIIFLSATISINNDFNFFIKQMCLDAMVYNDDLVVNDYKSPYFYSDQTKLFVYGGNEDIKDNFFTEKIASLILAISHNTTNKRMLVLCTAYSQIQTFKSIILKKNNVNPDNFLYQEKGISKEILLESYLKGSNSVLFGTNTFWEGIDLPQKKLEILLIYKLPFSNPSNPFVQAAVKYYQANNRNAFIEYQLPEAIIKLKQGYGRLIRGELDMGVCILTDPRIIKKRYGKTILDSLPVESELFSDNAQLLIDINKFLGNN